MVKPQLPMMTVVNGPAPARATRTDPSDLRVVVRVVVDDAGHEREPVRVHALPARAHRLADRRDPALVDGDAASEAGASVPSMIDAVFG